MAVSAAIGVGVASIGAGLFTASQAQSQAKKAQGDQRAAQDRLIAGQNQQQAEQASNALRDQQISSERAQAGAATGYNSTILTSPLGIQGNSSNQSGKTLLGS